MNQYMLYQAETVKSARVQREADVRAGELAEGFARLRRSLLPVRRRPAADESAEREAIRHSCVTAACWY
jgi:hypothetical protein